MYPALPKAFGFPTVSLFFPLPLSPPNPLCLLPPGLGWRRGERFCCVPRIGIACRDAANDWLVGWLVGWLGVDVMVNPSEDRRVNEMR